MYSAKLSFWKEVRKINGIFENSIQCKYCKTLPREMVTIFDRKYKEVLDNPACQTSSAAGRQLLPADKGSFLLWKIDIFI